MITTAEIKKKAERLYPEILRAVLTNDPGFPRSIPADKRLSKDFAAMNAELKNIMAGSKDRIGYGYRLQTKPVRTRLHGMQDMPEAIIFDTLEDFLRFLKKDKEFSAFIQTSSQIKEAIPELESWLVKYPLAVIENAGKWPDILKVCNWFLHQFQPDTFYIRELPISVHTKFIEENKGLLKNLFDFLIPNKADLQASDFAKRFRLKYPLDLIRFRFLDSAIQAGPYSDLSVPADEFAAVPVPCRQVLIVENKINYLTLPPLKDTIAVWGKGFAVESLKHVKWWKDKQLYYWSDLDAQGFQMLSQVRSYFPQTRSILMDLETLQTHDAFWVTGTASNVRALDNLTPDESEVFLRLTDNNSRLEQERIMQAFVLKKLQKII
ncbi:MAG: DUF2220 family protein [Hymenobacteraceae bacterium]|nr:DUF2220 family protein [Hymenobacteraceae bacterium]MDX5443404.1 DUF2220 family protein [Hymenobacteraceae bacterium]MDX5511063.1 DUF2220 family protein [Hymenobacteraceae bacterium]